MSISIFVLIGSIVLFCLALPVIVALWDFMSENDNFITRNVDYILYGCQFIIEAILIAIILIGIVKYIQLM